MDTPEKRKQLEALGEEIFELSKLASRARAKALAQDRVENLSETEILTLDFLRKHEVATVGEIQKEIGVLPAQMSRIIRTLEDKEGTAYITCSINPQDRRKIDVSLTPEGAKSLEAYRATRLGMIMNIMSVLDLGERDEFMRILRKIRGHISSNPRIRK